MSERIRRILIYVLGCATGAVLASAWLFAGELPFTLSPGEPVADASGPQATSTYPAPDVSGAVKIEDQAAGIQVRVAEVNVPPPGVWVAVRDVLPGGALGNVLGAARARGPVADFTIPLLRSTQAGRMYAIALYRDDGNSSFDVDADSAYVDFDTGEPVVAPFKAR